ncbi:MAG: esterase [Verrucomicrobiales bacterium]|nr:esterase [Verrucomicrobiales bacterium]
MKRRLLILGILALSLAGPAPAQTNRPAPIDSPVVHQDRTVTFRVRAPLARKVELNGQFLKGNQAMLRDESGVWALTIGPVEPNLYPYHFVVDGTAVADPSNPDQFPNERFKSSLVDIPGTVPSLHANQSVPHGELVYGYYESTTLRRTRPLVVYTPPGYRSGDRKYPVLYLVSGTTDTEETWFRAGRANFILDNLIAQSKAVPMLVVMPYGNMMMGTPMPSSPQAAEMYQVFSDELLTGIIPHVEANYRVLADREHRALAGFSRGGGQSLFTAFKNPGLFAWVASYAAYLTPEVCEQRFPEMLAKPDDTNARLRLLWLGVGREDFLYPQARDFNRYLRDRKIRYTELITDGGHTWMNARHYLAETLVLFFR